MKITKFDRATAKTFGPLIAPALEAFAKEHGLTVVSAGGTFDGKLKYIARLEFQVSDPAIREATERADWSQFCSAVGLKPEDYGREFSHNGHTYKAVAFKLGTDRPLVACRDDGQMVAFRAPAIDAFLKGQA